MTRKSTKAKKPKETAAKQYARFVATAKALGAPDDAREFDKAFKKIVGRKVKSAPT